MLQYYTGVVMSTAQALSHLYWEIWSGARDLNPGPHGPEPYIHRVLSCPAGSYSVLAYPISLAVVSSRVPPVPTVSSRTQFRSLSCPLVSFCVLLVPRMRDTSVTRRLANSGVEAIGYASLAGLRGPLVHRAPG